MNIRTGKFYQHTVSLINLYYQKCQKDYQKTTIFHLKRLLKDYYLAQKNPQNTTKLVPKSKQNLKLRITLILKI